MNLSADVDTVWSIRFQMSMRKFFLVCASVFYSLFYFLVSFFEGVPSVNKIPSLVTGRFLPAVGLSFLFGWIFIDIYLKNTNLCTDNSFLNFHHLSTASQLLF